MVPLRRAKGKRKRTDEGPAAEEGRAGQRKARWASPRYQQKALTEAWLAFLALPLPPHLLKQAKPLPSCLAQRRRGTGRSLSGIHLRICC